MYILPLVLLLVGLHLPNAFGWGLAGHEIIATISQIHLHPSVLPTLCDILDLSTNDSGAPPCHLAPVAAWADRVRYTMRWSAPLHYIGAIGDHPCQTCVFPGPRGWAGTKFHNVLGGIHNVTTILDDYVSRHTPSHAVANEALKFLIHFLGDLHMPLHLTGRDRGGNSAKVRFGGRSTNLHSVWDGLLIAKAIRETPINYTYPLPSRQIERSLRGTIYDSYVRRIMWEGVMNKWKDEIPSWLDCQDTTSIASKEQHDTGAWQVILSNLNRISISSEDGPEHADDNVICPYHWAKPIHQLNCDIVWPPELDEPPYGVHTHPARINNHNDIHDRHDELEDNEPNMNHTPLLQLDTPEYAGYISEQMIIEKLFAQAGVRLAAILNWLFADEEQLQGMERTRLTTVDIKA